MELSLHDAVAQLCIHIGLSEAMTRVAPAWIEATFHATVDVVPC
jgi:hypothetical protein